ncbi:MAG: hypothetical protein ACE5IW_06900 [bacterium]
MGVRKHYVPLIILITSLYFTCSQKSVEGLLPDKLADLHLVRVEKSEVAQNKLSKMHHGVDFANYDSVIGTYQDEGNEAVVYLTIFDSEEKSAEMMSRMVENIKAQKSPEFSYIKQFEKEGKTIHSAASAGLDHYFFQGGRRNIWISAPTTFCELVLGDFLTKLETP